MDTNRALTETPIDHQLAYALQHQMAGRLDEAERLYETLLRQFPDQLIIRQAAQWLRNPASDMTTHLVELRGLISPFFLPGPDCKMANLGTILEETFGRKADGIFVDIGAGDGRTDSKTEFLASLGWGGLYIEADPVLFQRCQAWNRRNRGIMAENCAIGGSEGEVEFRHGRATVFRLDTMLQRHALERGFEVLVVDVDGAELDVLNSFDLAMWSPRMVIVGPEADSAAVRQLFTRHGYQEKHGDESGTIFVQPHRRDVMQPPAAPTPAAPSYNPSALAVAIGNAQNRDTWVAAKLRDLSPGFRLLDIGAGECQYAKHCDHLHYTAQDVAVYDGQGDGAGLQTGAWDFRKVNLVCDVYDIPEDQPYDAVLCTEVLEHVVDPVRAIEKMSRVVRPGGTLILTAPFCALTHFAPHFHATGFSSYFYRHHLGRLGFDIEELVPNGDYFLYLAQETLRLPDIIRKYLRQQPDAQWTAKTMESVLQMIALSRQEASTETGQARSSELLAFGFHVLARKT